MWGLSSEAALVTNQRGYQDTKNCSLYKPNKKGLGGTLSSSPCGSLCLFLNKFPSFTISPPVRGFILRLHRARTLESFCPEVHHGFQFNFHIS